MIRRWFRVGIFFILTNSFHLRLGSVEGCGNWTFSVIPPEGRITGGRQALPGEFPWMVAILGKNGKQFCGGSLIQRDYVLTASHCFATFTADDLTRITIHIGDHDLKDDTESKHEIRQIQKVIRHSGFDPKTYKNDIALLKLDWPVNYTQNIQPICLPIVQSGTAYEDKVEGQRAVVAGWGQLISGLFGCTVPILRKVEIPIWNYTDCKRIYDQFAPGRLGQAQLCAGDGKRNRDACIGDSGGPLMVRGQDSVQYQIGIVSWGKGCGSFPGVYTDIRKYTSWILQHIEKK